MERYISKSPQETMAVGAAFAKKLQGGTLVLLEGDLGAGKTTFCRGVAQGLQARDPVSSPTYAIVNVYRGRVPFAHFDAWRIDGPEDLEAAGFYDYLDAGAVVAVEWSVKILPYVDSPYIKVTIRQLPNQQREIIIDEHHFRP